MTTGSLMVVVIFMTSSTLISLALPGLMVPRLGVKRSDILWFRSVWWNRNSTFSLPVFSSIYADAKVGSV
jgi:hypothetical protein